MLSPTRAGWRFAAFVMVVGAFDAMADIGSRPPDTLAVVSGPLTLDRALALASRYELKLRAAGLRAEAARERIADADRRPNPALSVTEENFGGHLNGGHREATVAIGQALELGGDRRARRATAEAEHRLASAEVGVVAREGLALVAERFILAWSLQTRLRRLTEAESLTRQAIRAATERHQAGASPRLEILRAESRAMAQAVERQRTESELDIARRDLASSWGESASFDSLVAPELAVPGEMGEWQSRLPAHPELSRASAIETLAAARVDAAAAARFPNLTISGGVRRLEEIPGTGFVAGVEVLLPLWSRGAGDLAAARRELEASVVERRATERRLRVAIAVAIERLRAAAAVYDTLRLRVRPAREQLVEELLHGYRAGRTSYLDLVAEQSNLLETELATIDAQADLWRARLRLDVLTGTVVPAPPEER